MKPRSSMFALSPRWRWLVTPVYAAGAGSIALAPFLEESAVLATEYLPLAAVPGMAAVIFWINRVIFRAGQLAGLR